MLSPWADGGDGEQVPESQGSCRAADTALSEASSRMRLSITTESPAVLSRDIVSFKCFAPWHNILQGESPVPVGKGNGNHIFLAE